MKNLKTIQNYIYGKTIQSKIANNNLNGTFKGNSFKIFYSNKKTFINKGKTHPLLILEKNNKIYHPKDAREIVRILQEK